MTSSPPADLRPGLAGLLLAAGAGTRLGTPKALVMGPDGASWANRAALLLLEAGCSPAIVVLGADATEAERTLPADPRVRTVVAEEWRDGMSASLAAGLRALSATEATSALVTLVDLPGMPVAAMTRLAENGSAPSVLRQATYGGRPGHPVLLGRDHWPGVAATLVGDRGARAYLSSRGADAVECGDLWDGRDVDALDA